LSSYRRNRKLGNSRNRRRRKLPRLRSWRRRRKMVLARGLRISSLASGTINRLRWAKKMLILRSAILMSNKSALPN